MHTHNTLTLSIHKHTRTRNEGEYAELSTNPEYTKENQPTPSRTNQHALNLQIKHQNREGAATTAAASSHSNPKTDGATISSGWQLTT